MRRIGRLKRGKLFGMLWLGTLLAGCQTMGSGGLISPSVGPSALTFCDGAEPIYWSTKDTRPTIAQVKEHNAVGVAECGWKKGQNDASKK